MKTIFFDIECYYGLFLVVTLDAACPQSIIDEYIAADIDKNIPLKLDIRNKMPLNIYVINKNVNDLIKICNVFTTDTLVIGYNNDSYDNTLIDYLLTTRNTIDVHGNVLNSTKQRINGKNVYKSEHITTILKGVSDEIINSHDFWTHPKRTNTNLKWFRSPYKSLDFFRCIFDSVNRKSLKQALINSDWYRIQDLPLPPDTIILDEQVNDIIDYCINDVLGLRHLFRLEAEEIGLRFTIGKEYGYNFLSSNRANIADKLFINFYSKESGISVKELKDLRTYHTQIVLKDLISDKIHFDNPIFKDLYNKIANHTYNYGVKEVQHVVYLNGTGYNFMLGGMHSIDRVAVFSTNKIVDMVLRDVDADSFYPRTILNERVCPKHLNPDFFLPLGEKLLDERLTKKKLAKTDKKYEASAFALKIILNIVLFGKLGANDSFLKDDAAKFKMTINGQFYLMMLIERFEANGIHVVSVNTDGIVCYFPKSKESLYNQLCEEWCKELNHSVSFTDFEKYIRRDVNNYIAIKTGFSKAIVDGMDRKKAESKYVKCKGFFDTNVDIKKGYKTQIISIAVRDFYLYGTMPEETIKNSTNIYDFLIAQKVDKTKYNVSAHFVDDEGEVVEEKIQHSTRFYMSNSGVALTKKDKFTAKHTALSSHRYATVMNDFIKHDDFKDYNVNVNYYIAAAYDVLYILNNQKTKGTKNVNQKYNSEQGLFD